MAQAVDLTDLDMRARGVPHAEFARLRRDAPVARLGEAPPDSGFWSAIPAQIEAGFTTFCIKPSQFTDDPDDADRLCREVMHRVGQMLP